MLAPSRGDRARLEALLSDVWTRESLPFPGMTVRARNEHLIRTSAHSVMRKLSVTSITSTFTKRSASLASIPRGGSDEESGDEDTSVFAATPLTTVESAPAVTDIHLDDGDINEVHLLVVNDDNSDRATASTARTRSLITPSNTANSMENSRSPRQRRRITKKNLGACQLGDFTPESVSLTISPSPSMPAAAGALRSRSINGPNLKRQASLLSRKSVRSVCSAMDSAGRGVRKRRAGDQQGLGIVEFHEGQCPSSPRFLTPRPSTSPSKSGVNRWSRVDVLRRGTVAQGIRGFFR